MRKVSKKRALQKKEYLVLRNSYLLENSKCERCDETATENHHKNGRNGLRLLDVTYFMATCRTCHRWIHEHPKQAREQGWLI